MTQQVFDFELEEWVKSHKVPGRSVANNKLTWVNRVQYAVGHVINDYYTMEPFVRSHVRFQKLLDRRWPQTMNGFLSPLHYSQVYNQVLLQLSRIFEAEQSTGYPVALYEQWHTRVSQLDLRLSMIFQTVWQNLAQPDQFKIQKFLVEDNAEVTRAFVHMTNVFWNSEFGQCPDQIEVYALLAGRKYTFTKQELSLEESLDYVMLLTNSVESHRSGKDSRLGDDTGNSGKIQRDKWRLGVS